MVKKKHHKNENLVYTVFRYCDFRISTMNKTTQAPRPPTKRMSVTLPTDVAEMLELLATNQGITQNEAIRKAIATEAYFQKEIKQGSTVLIMNSDKSVKEVVFR